MEEYATARPTDVPIALTVDGRPVEAPGGFTILEAALAAGIAIPRLCHDPRLKPLERCGLCIVEVAGRAEPVWACATPVAAGMVVATRTPALEEARRRRLGDFFADHWADCVAPCTLACPATTDAQGYIGLIAQGRHRDAVELIKQTNPFPGISAGSAPVPARMPAGGTSWRSGSGSAS